MTRRKQKQCQVHIKKFNNRATSEKISHLTLKHRLKSNHVTSYFTILHDTLENNSE